MYRKIALFVLLLNFLQCGEVWGPHNLRYDRGPLSSTPQAPFVPFTVKYSIDIGESEWEIKQEADLKYLNEVLKTLTPTSDLQVTLGGKVRNFSLLQWQFNQGQNIEKFFTPDQEPPLPPPAYPPSTEVPSASAAASRPRLPETFTLRIGPDGQFLDPQTSEYQSLIAGASLKIIYDRSTGKSDELVNITSWDSLTSILNTLKRRNVYSVSIKFQREPLRYISGGDATKVSFSPTRVTFK